MNRTNNTSSRIDAWAELLNDPEVREIGGEENSEGVDFSRYWAMSQLFLLERPDTADYAVVFEYLQDVLIIDSPTEPKRASLYQIKKKEKGTWTRSALCADATKSPSGAKSGRKSKGKTRLRGRSPLGKLYAAVQKLATKTQTEGVFLSNALCSLKLASPDCSVPGYSRISIAELHKSDSSFIKARLALELGRKKKLTGWNTIFLEQSRMAPASMRETAQGLAARFLEDQYPSVPNISGRLIEKLLQSFSSLSGPQPAMTSLSQIIERKGFTRKQFTDLLSSLASLRSASEVLDTVIGNLKSEGMPTRTADKIRREANRLNIEMTRHPEIKETLYWEVAIHEAHRCKDQDCYLPIINTIVSLIKDAAERQQGYLPPSDETLMAIALLAINYVDKEFAPPSSKPSIETR